MIAGTSFLRNWLEKPPRLNEPMVFIILIVKVNLFLKKFVLVSNSDTNIMHCLPMAKFFEMPFMKKGLN